MLIPTKENIQKLFETHQNQCAFSNCNQKIIDSDGHVLGNILFIETNKKEQPRFNPEITNRQMIDYHNLILLCDHHAFDIEFKEKKHTVSKLRKEILTDLKYLQDYNFKITNEILEKLVTHFIDYHDPDRLSHIAINEIQHGGTVYGGGSTHVDITCTGIYLKPTKHFTKKKFEIIDTRRKIREFDKVVFYSKNSTYDRGTQADIEIHSKMRIEGIVPDLPPGEYLVSLRSAIDETNKMEDDLPFTVL